VTFVTSGLWRLKLEGWTVDVGPNEMIFIPANVPHTAEAVETLVEKGYVVPLHSHDNQQVTFVTSGIWRFKLEGRTVEVGPNEMIFIPANIPHTAEALETLVAYDVFTPPREDWINGDDAYLRAK